MCSEIMNLSLADILLRSYLIIYLSVSLRLHLYLTSVNTCDTTEVFPDVHVHPHTDHTHLLTVFKESTSCLCVLFVAYLGALDLCSG